MVALNDWLGVGPDDIRTAECVERQLLACCLRSEGGIGFDDVAAMIESADFAVYAHGILFGAMSALRASDAPITAATVYQHMLKAGTAPELGEKPAVWLAELLELEATDAHAVYFAGLVREASRKRGLKRVAVQIVGITSDPARSAGDVAADCEQLLFAASNDDVARASRGFAELVPSALSRIDARTAKGKPDGLPTGFREVDAALNGLKPGQLIVLGARPGAGKTALSLAIASNAARSGVPVFFASMEMPESEIMDRVLSMRSGVPLRAIQRGDVAGTPAEQLVRAGEQLRAEPFFLNDQSDMTAARLASFVRRAVRRDGVRLAIVDYLQLLTPENPKDNRTQQVGLMARRMKQLARACGIPVLLLCQLNREVEGRNDGKPRLSDLRESGEIEQHADAVLLLSTQRGQDEEAPTWAVDVVVAKNRNGPVAEKVLTYRRANTRFENQIH